MCRFFILMMIGLSVFSNGFTQSVPAIIPTPISTIQKDGHFELNNETILYYDSASIHSKNFLESFLLQHYKIKLKAKPYNGDFKAIIKKDMAIKLKKKKKNHHYTA